MALHSKVNGFRLSLQVGISGPTFGNEKTKDVWNQAGYTILESKNAKWSNFFFPPASIYYGFAGKSIFYLHNEEKLIGLLTINKRHTETGKRKQMDESKVQHTERIEK